MTYIITFTILLLSYFHFSFDGSHYQDSFMEGKEMEFASETYPLIREIAYKKTVVSKPAKVAKLEVKEIEPKQEVAIKEEKKAEKKEVDFYRFELIKAENISQKVSFSGEQLFGSIEISSEGQFSTEGFQLGDQQYASMNAKMSGKMVTLNVDGDDIKAMVSHDENECVLFLPSGWRLTFSS